MKIKELKKMIKDAFIAEAETDAEYFYSPVREDLDEADAQINIVTTMDGKTIVGTYQYGVGFKSNEAGKKMGFNDNPTSIPNGTKMSKDDLLNEVDDMTFVANLEAELAEGLYEAKYEDIDPETKEILNSLEGLRAKADDEKFETLLNNVLTMVRQYMYGDRKLNIGALKAAIKKGDFASLLKFQKTPNPGNPYMAEDLYEAEEEEQTDVTIDAKEKTTDGGEEKSSDDSIVVGKKIVKLSSLSDEKQDILNSLETLRAQAEEFGDAKFETQVGNTITFFNRDFVVGGDKPTKEKVDESDDMEEGKKSNKQKLIDAGYSESDAEDFVDEFEQGGVKVPQKVKDILSDKSSMNESMFPMWKKLNKIK